ncbi:Long-chain-fatty-acid--CoA ligase [Bordetella tumbae]|uniref:class I adenylate-forming enzyme family protein n=1 Tax=Bordetella tumbae TaxID=1649139 RepID=UPI0039EF2A5B
MSVPNIADMLSLHAQMRPSSVALVHGDESLTYAELNKAVLQRAAMLQEMGIRTGNIVAVALKDGIEHVLMLYAIARAGAVILPMDCRWKEFEKLRVAKHFQPTLIMVEPGGDIPGAVCITADAGWNKKIIGTLIDHAFPDGNRGVVMSLSSGTTGRPKGPMLTHSQFQARFWTHWVDLGFGSREVYVNATPLYFGGGRAFAMSTLHAGGKLVLFPPPYAPEDLATEIARTQGTILFLVPTLLRRMMNTESEKLIPMKALTTLISSGSALTAEERKRIKEDICPNFLEYYSSTEGGGITVLPSADQIAHGDSVGRPVYGVEVQVVDENHHPVPRGETGRIRYRGPAVANGFYNDPEASAEAFYQGWFYPGDLGSLGTEGYLTLKGRSKDMIIRGGVNIYPLEIETILSTHESIAEVAVVGWPSREFNEEVAAFVTLRKGHALDEEALKRMCRATLAPYKIPREIFLLDELPRNSGGKIIKSELTAKLPPL